MGLKARLYMFLTVMLLMIIVVSFTVLISLARQHVQIDSQQRLTEVADLIAQDVVIANITDDYARLEQRFRQYANQSFIHRVEWRAPGQQPLQVDSSLSTQVPQWFVDLFDDTPLIFEQPVTWFGKSYGELRLEGDKTITINNLWYLMLYWLVVLAFIAFVVILGIELMTRPVIQQIQSLANDARHIGAGNLDEKIAIKGTAEVFQLALSMEQMRIALSDYTQHEAQQQAVLRAVSDENAQRLTWLKNLLNTLPAAVMLEDEQGRVVFSNQLYSDFFSIALSPKELVGYASEQIMLDIRLLFADSSKFMQQTEQAMASMKAVRQQLLGLQDGRWLMRDYIPIRDERTGAFVGRLWLYQDVTENHHLEQMLRWQANHDALTGLINRTAFEQHLQQLPKPSTHVYALLYIDLDQFKLVNDTAGHMAGDELLKQVAQLLSGQLPPNAVLARMGGDEFAMLIVADSVQAMLFAERVRLLLAHFRFVYLERNYQIGASIGVVPDVGAEQDAKMLMAMADAACYAAKNAGRNHVWLYQSSDAYLRGQQEEMRIVSELHTALELNRFELHAQKLIPLQRSDDQQLHIELLLRWNDQAGTPISPSLFIPAAERYGLMHRIDRWVIEQSLTYLVAHPALLNRIAVCAINLSGASFSQPDLGDFVQEVIRRTEFPGHKLCFEITETAAVTQLSQAHDFIAAMKPLGCRFALDDFGSGQSSFRYLKQLPVDYLKIDGSFVQSMMEDRTNSALVRGMQEIAQALGIMTIAEFVETDEVVEVLRAIGVDYAQGWRFHRAQPLSTL